MRKTASCLVLASLFIVGAAGLSAGQTFKAGDLAPRYQEWLKLVSYILLPAERDVFLKLSADRERDIFIEAFWKQRDPTPETPQNEYKDEHIRRFEYANTQLNRGTPREGWMTDMGRMYIILGEPNSRERFDGTLGIHPCQVWYYFGDAAKGLPTYFGLVFFQRSGGGEYKLYNPVSDGPESLLVDTRKIDLSNPEQVYQKIKELAPTLAPVAVSIVPGQLPYRFSPSPQNNIILARIIESPRKDVNPSYATHFLNYKGVVSTEYLTNYVECDAAVALIRDPELGLDFLHFSISPRKMSIDYYQPQDQYYCSFKLNVSLRKGDEVVFQYSKDYPFYFPPNQLENIQGNGIAVQDYFPIAEGTYDLTILLQNPVGKEFSIYEKSVQVAGKDAPLEIAPPTLGYKLQDAASGGNAPFKAGGKQLLAEPKNTFGLDDDIAFVVQVSNIGRGEWDGAVLEGRVASSQAKDKAIQSFSIGLKEFPYSRMIGLPYAFRARDLVPDYYEMDLTLKSGDGETLGAITAPFILSTAETVPHPVTLVRTLPPANNFLYFLGLATQYEKIGVPERAEACFQKAHEMQPDYPEGIIGYADFLLRINKPEEAMRLVEKLEGNEKFRFNFYLLKGRAFMGRGDFGAAVESLLEGNKIYNSDTALLNALGFSYYRTGRKKEALGSLGASLRLNPEQPDIKDLVARIEKELK